MGYSSFTLLAGTVMALYSTHLIETWLVALVIVVAICAVPFCRHTRKLLNQFILLCIGILIGTHFVSNLAQQHTQLPERQWLSVYLTIEHIDYHSDKRSRFVASLSRVLHGNELITEDCQCRVQLYWYEDRSRNILSPGQQYRAEIKLKMPTTYWNQGSERPARYLWAKQLVKQGYVREMQLTQVEPSVRWRVYRTFEATELEFVGMLQALAIGYRGSIPFEQRDVWQRNGLQHLMAISGLHISLVAGLIFLTLQRGIARLPHKGTFLLNRERLLLTPVAAVVALIVALLYTSLAGFAISAQRAWLMLLLFWGQRWLGLTTRNWKRLWHAVVILIVIDPGSWHDIGFWFSVLAVAVILLCQWGWRVNSSAGWTKRLLQTIYLQLLFLALMGPLSLAVFGGVSLIAPVSNLLVVPIFAFWVLPLTLMGAIAAIAWADTFAANLWWLAEQPLIVLQPLLEWLARLPIGWLGTSSIAIESVLLWAFGLLLLLPLWLMRYYWLMSAVSGLLSAGFLLLGRWHQPDVIFHVLDVGQAQALVIERDNAAWLIDLGRRFHIGRSHFESVIDPFIKQRRLRIERVSLTHQDADHSGDWRTAKARLSAVDWSGALTQKPCQAGQQGVWRDIQWQVVWPKQARAAASNSSSCVYRFTYGTIDWLVTGDIGFAEERILVEEKRVGDVEILVAPHHGSAFSLGSLMLKATQPQLTVVSVGGANNYGMPDKYTHQRVLESGSEWATTADYGQLSIEIDAQSWTLKTPLLFDKTNAKSYSSTSQQ